MLTYVIRRLLLIIPTLLGMTAVVFTVMANAPGGIGGTLLSRTGEMRPDERRAREAYLNERYGLDKSKFSQYVRWLNKVSPVGFRTWTADAPEVRNAAAEERKLESPVQSELDSLRRQLVSTDLSTEANRTLAGELQTKIGRLEREIKRIDVTPDPGELRWSQPTLKFPDLGNSIPRGRSVNVLVAEALPISLMLQLLALPMSYMLAIWLGVQQARKRGKFLDYSISSLTLALWCLPAIWVAVMLVGFLASERYLPLFPATGLNDLNESAMQFLPSYANGSFRPGWLLDRAHHLVLPLICLTYANFAFLSRLTRGALLDSLNADFVRTARAKGLPERFVLYRHAFRNSLIPLITVLANLLPAMVGGSIVVETVFGINGMGKLAVDAAGQRDFELVLSITLVASVLTLIAYLLADFCYTIADPRVTFE